MDQLLNRRTQRDKDGRVLLQTLFVTVKTQYELSCLHLLTLWGRQKILPFCIYKFQTLFFLMHTSYQSNLY